MVVFKVRELLKKNNMSRYKLEQYTSLSKLRVNDYYFGRVQFIKTDELEQLCDVFNCEIQDIVEVKRKKKRTK